jgi:chromosome segregation ATPase
MRRSGAETADVSVARWLAEAIIDHIGKLEKVIAKHKDARQSIASLERKAEALEDHLRSAEYDLNDLKAELKVHKHEVFAAPLKEVGT